MKTYIIFLMAALSLAGCATPRSQHPAFSKQYEQMPPPQFDGFVYKFVESAKRQDIDSIMNMTSKISSINEYRYNTIKDFHQRDTIPFLNLCAKLEDLGAASISKKETGTGPGWVMRKQCVTAEDETYLVFFSVLLEDSIMVMSSVTAK